MKNFFNSIKYKVKYAFSQWSFLKAFFSPLRRPKIQVYWGPIAVGVPYFFPRKMVRDREKPGYYKFVNLKFGFSMCGLGWKSKWSETDYRWEWAPILSFVCCGRQLALKVVVEHPDQYWTIWLYYTRNTDKKKSRKERIQQCREEFPQIWKVWHKKRDDWTTDREEVIDYYDVVLKDKYINHGKHNQD